MRPKKYTPEQIQFARDNISGRSHAELIELFNRHFDLSCSVSKMENFLRYYGIRNGRIKRNKYTPEQIRFVRDNLPGRTRKEMLELFNRRFGLSITKEEIATLIANNKFRNGLPPFRLKGCPMKGKHYDPGTAHSRPIGAQRVSDKSNTKIKIKPGVWAFKHFLIWEAAHGPIPEGHTVIFADRNNQNFDLDNLLLVSRRELIVMARGGLIFPDKDLTKTGKIIADIKLLINDRLSKKEKAV
jgi:hypothetical protein